MSHLKKCCPDGMDIPFGIVYSAESEFLDAEEVDEKLRAHARIEVRLSGKDKG